MPKNARQPKDGLILDPTLGQHHQSPSYIGLNQNSKGVEVTYLASTGTQLVGERRLYKNIKELSRHPHKPAFMTDENIDFETISVSIPMSSEKRPSPLTNLYAENSLDALVEQSEQLLHEVRTKVKPLAKQ